MDISKACFSGNKISKIFVHKDMRDKMELGYKILIMQKGVILQKKNYCSEFVKLTFNVKFKLFRLRYTVIAMTAFVEAVIRTTYV